MNLKDIFKNRTERAASLIARPEAEPRTIAFSSADLSSDESLTDIHLKFPGKKLGAFYLYKVTVSGSSDKLVSDVRSAFRRLRAQETYKMSRDNATHQETTTLYVGKCEDLYSRFRTHLGRGRGKTTWSLYLSKWAVPLQAEFKVEYYEFMETTADYVSLMEAVLWDELCPLFGKKGD